MLKEGTGKVRLRLYSKTKKLRIVQIAHWNCSNKVLLGFSSIKYAKIKHEGVLISLKGSKKIKLSSYLLKMQ